MLQAFRNRLENGDLLSKVRLLSYVGDTNPLLDVQVAIVWLGQSPQNFEQRRFACSVAPDQANALWAVGADGAGVFALINQKLAL